MKKLLNVGCGFNCHKDWINLDLHKSKYVDYYNIKNKLPFKDGSLDVIYHSHVLEHLDKLLARKFIADCYRVLKKGGIIRIAVPDLEIICLEYLKHLKRGYDDNDKKSVLNYQWNKLELFDQLLRQKKGGETLSALRKGEFNFNYVLRRNGEEIERLLRHTQKKNNKIYCFLRGVVDLFKNTNPQKSGEAHRWMYDRLDLKILLESAGFRNFKIMRYDKSKIKNWNKYALDKVKNKNRPRKPDSIFCEAEK